MRSGVHPIVSHVDDTISVALDIVRQTSKPGRRLLTWCVALQAIGFCPTREMRGISHATTGCSLSRQHLLYDFPTLLHHRRMEMRISNSSASGHKASRIDQYLRYVNCHAIDNDKLAGRSRNLSATPKESAKKVDLSAIKPRRSNLLSLDAHRQRTIFLC
jgi:hypothetical protein